MATASTMPWYANHHEPNKASNAQQQQHHHQQAEQAHRHRHLQPNAANVAAAAAAAAAASRGGGGSTCPPSSFPESFQDFFATLDEDVDDQSGMLEDKLIPRNNNNNNYPHHHHNNNNKDAVPSVNDADDDDVDDEDADEEEEDNDEDDDNVKLMKQQQQQFQQQLQQQLQQQQRWQKRTFQRRSSEIEVRMMHGSSLQGHGVGGANNCGIGGGYDPKSPTPSRRRSSSIAVTRPTPDLHRFLQAEAGPWGHLSPSPRSPTRTPSLSPGGLSTTTTSHLSPGASPAGHSPTSPAAPSSAAAAAASRLPPQPKHRGRTSSMPAVPRHRPMLADTRRGGLLGNAGTASGNNGGGGSGSNGDDDADDGVEYYRVRSFSITANGVFNLGDALKSRRSRSINSVTSSNTSCSSVRDIKDAKLLKAVSQLSGIENGSVSGDASERPASYKVGMLGASGVGKTALTAQFCTSDYICAYDASLDDEYGQKSVSVMIDEQESELEIIDHPAQEMSTEAFCATYNVDVFVIVYSVVDRSSFKYAEQTLMYLWNNNYMANRGVILVGNMVDLERKREVSTIMGRRVATTFNCKFIETSSGIAHHTDELLVGIIAQIKLNPQRNRDQQQQANSHRRRHKHTHSKKILKSILSGFHRKTKSCENLFTI